VINTYIINKVQLASLLTVLVNTFPVANIFKIIRS